VPPQHQPVAEVPRVARVASKNRTQVALYLIDVVLFPDRALSCRRNVCRKPKKTYVVFCPGSVSVSRTTADIARP
jgi:hypothetical protein